MSTAPESPPGPVAPEHPVIFFDGVCGLCNTTVDFLLRQDRKGVFRFAPLQGELAAGRLSAADVASLKSLVLWDEKGIHRRSTAVWRILRGLGGGWKFLAALLWAVPWPVRDVGYRLVSVLRYRLFGKKDACRMPTTEERSRFLA